MLLSDIYRVYQYHCTDVSIPINPSLSIVFCITLASVTFIGSQPPPPVRIYTTPVIYSPPCRRLCIPLEDSSISSERRNPQAKRQLPKRSGQVLKPLPFYLRTAITHSFRIHPLIDSLRHVYVSCQTSHHRNASDFEAIRDRHFPFS